MLDGAALGLCGGHIGGFIVLFTSFLATSTNGESML